MKRIWTIIGVENVAASFAWYQRLFGQEAGEPAHDHRAEEEMFLILDGEGELRFGSSRYPLRAMDVVACPTGGADVAHQIINTGTRTLRYLAVSTVAAVEQAEYPDSGKIGVYGQDRNFGGTWRSADAVDYYDGEATQVVAANPPG